MAAIWHGGRFPVEGFDEASKGCMNGHLGMEIVEAGDECHIQGSSDRRDAGFILQGKVSAQRRQSRQPVQRAAIQ